MLKKGSIIYSPRFKIIIMKKFVIVQVLVLFSHLFFQKTFAQGEGINATGAFPDPSTMLHVDAGTKGFLVTGTLGGAVPDLGPGSRLMFYPAKAAVRAGNVTGTQWDNINVGAFSVAMVNNTIASGTASTALGGNTIASGPISTAMGYFTTANGANSTAMGRYAIASGNNFSAMGSFVSTNGKTGAFIISDAIGTGSMSSVDNEMTMGFSGGFRLYTNSIATYRCVPVCKWQCMAERFRCKP